MSEIMTQMIDFPSNEHTTPGYLARPNDDAQHPGIVVIQEWWGLVQHIKDVSRRLAHAGYVALAPDLYHGEATSEPDEARKLAMGLDMDRALNEIMAAARTLQKMDEVMPKKIGVVGWCMGGAAALGVVTWQSDVEIGATVAFYGRPPAVEDVAKIQTPVLGLYGSEDSGIPVRSVREFEEALQTHRIPHEIHIYEGAQHAFFNETRPNIYHPEAAKDAWQKTLDWFQRHLV